MAIIPFTKQRQMRYPVHKDKAIDHCAKAHHRYHFPLRCYAWGGQKEYKGSMCTFYWYYPPNPRCIASYQYIHRFYID